MNSKLIPDSMTRAMSGRDYVRELVRQRDGRRCQCCGKKWQVGERRFDVHHLNGMCGKKTYSYDRVEDIDGLITFCHRCHLRQDSVKLKMATKTGEAKHTLQGKRNYRRRGLL